MITFSDGEVAVTLLRGTSTGMEEVRKETMKFDGRFVWKEEDSSNER